MAITFRPITAPDDDELMRLHELNPGYTVERLADGALLVSPNGAAGGMRNAELALQLGLWERRARCGPVFDSSTGFRLPDTSVFSPDGGSCAPSDGSRFHACNANAISTARRTRRSSWSREPTSARSN